MDRNAQFHFYILATVYFQYPKLGSFFDMEYYFCQLAYQDSKVSKRFVGLIEISVLPPLTATGVNKMTPMQVGTSYSEEIRFYSNENVSATHQIAWVGPLNPQIAWIRSL